MTHRRVCLPVVVTVLLCAAPFAHAQFHNGTTGISVAPTTVGAGDNVAVGFSFAVWNNFAVVCPWEIWLDGTPGQRDGVMLTSGGSDHPASGKLVTQVVSATCTIPADTTGGAHLLKLASCADQSWSPFYSDVAGVAIEVVAAPQTDNVPPTFQLIVLQQELWPPNHQMVLAATVSGVADDTDEAPMVTLDISSSEPDDGPGDGDTGQDWRVDQVDGEWRIWLRAERCGPSPGREYTIDAVATDQAGNSAARSAVITVPHSKSKGSGGKK